MNLLILTSALVSLLSCSATEDDSRLQQQLQETETKGTQALEAIAQYPGAPHEDKEGNLWFATVQAGLIRFDGKGFTTFTTKDGLGGNCIRGIHEDDDGTLWFATTGGLTKYDGDIFITLTEYEGTDYSDEGWGEFGHHRDLWEVMRDSKGVLWITTMDGVFRLEGSKFSRLVMPAIGSATKSEFTPKMVYTVAEDNRGHLWFGTDGAGAIRYDGKGFEVYTANANGLCSDRVCEILQDARGDYWFGTSDGGVSRFDGTKFTTHLRRESRSIHAGWGRFMCMLEDSSGSVWFGVSDDRGGIFKYDGEEFQYFHEADGFPQGRTPSMRIDRKGNHWFCGTGGVFRYDGKRFHSLTKAGWSHQD